MSLFNIIKNEWRKTRALFHMIWWNVYPPGTLVEYSNFVSSHGNKKSSITGIVIGKTFVFKNRGMPVKIYCNVVSFPDGIYNIESFMIKALSNEAR